MTESLCSKLGSNVRVILSADHGHLEVPEEAKLSLYGGGISHMLESEPSGDARVLYFRWKSGFADELVEELKNRCGDDYLIMTSNELEKSGILGAGMNDLCRSRLGDLVIISRGSNVLQYGKQREQMGMLDLKSAHSGLTRQEMEVPLIVF